MRAALDGLAGILKLEVDLRRDAFVLLYDPSCLTESVIQDSIRDLGFEPRVVDSLTSAEPAACERSSVVPEPIATALADCREAGGLLLVDFCAEWCDPCKSLEETVLPDPQVKQALASYLFLQVDTDRFPAAATCFKIDAMPTLLALDLRGQELARFVGLMAPEQLARRLTEIVRQQDQRL